MKLFDKCAEFGRMVEGMERNRHFFYLRESDSPAGPVVRMKGRDMMMLGSNNYLGLTHHPKVVGAAVEAIRKYGTGICSSRVLAGTLSLHAELERKLAEFKGTEDAAVYSTGFMTMMGTITGLTREGDVVFSDEMNHASIVDGCRLSRASVRIYRHNDMGNLEEFLAACPAEASKLIVTDGVFSMKGTVADLPGIVRLASKYGAALMVDDAHGTGVLGENGRGTAEHFGLESQVDLVCGTFSKSLASTGGFTGAKKEVVEFLRLNARPFVFTASPAPSVAATVMACLEVIREEPNLLRMLHQKARFMKDGLKEAGFRLEETVTPIIPLLIGDDEKTFRMAGALEEEGIMVNPIVAPAVPRGKSLIRVSVMATFTPDQLAQAISRFKTVGLRLGVI